MRGQFFISMYALLTGQFSISMYALLTTLSLLLTVGADRTSRIPAGDGRPLLHGGNVTSPTHVPWHAGIWRPVGPVYDQECGGTLIAPDLVVTAAHCFWDYSRRKVLPNLHTYQVALGKNYREWHLDSASPAVQRMSVDRVILDSRFDGYVRRHLENDIALVVLTTNATLTEHVQLAEVDFDAGTPANGSVGVVAGWGYDETGDRSHELRSIELPYVDHDTCYQALGADRFKKLLTSDKFCAGFINAGKSVCQGDSGGGYVTVDKKSKKATIRGIVSIDFRPKEFPRDRCYSLFYTAFTNIGEPRYLAWIRETLYRGQPPPCPAVPRTESVQSVTCVRAGQVVDCSVPMSAGTIAVSTCARGFFVSGHLPKKSARCGSDGKWSDAEVTCVRPNCGRQVVSTVRINGEDIKDGVLPWSIGVYRHAWGYACAGTLITPTHVITSATCVSDRDKNMAVRSPSDLRLMAQKHFPDLDVSEPRSQLRGVAAVIRHENYGGDACTVHDIAMLVANQSFQLSNAVAPACLDWSGQQSVPSAVMVLGSTGRQVNYRTYTWHVPQRFSLVDRSRCIADIGPSTLPDRRKCVTSEVFCARQADDADSGDVQGGGLVGKLTGDRWHLLGVYSMYLAYKPSHARGWTDRMNGYTDVRQHLPWISDQLARAKYT